MTFPRDDADFARAVEDRFSKVDLLDGSPAEKIVLLLQELLADYPAIEIRQQDSLASFDSEPPTWYAYRDGLASDALRTVADRDQRV